MIDVENLYGGTVRRAQLVKQERVHGYTVGSLARARAEFTTYTGLKITWDTDASEIDAAAD